MSVGSDPLLLSISCESEADLPKSPQSDKKSATFAGQSPQSDKRSVAFAALRESNKKNDRVEKSFWSPKMMQSDEQQGLGATSPLKVMGGKSPLKRY